MTPELRSTILISRVENYNHIMRTTLFVFAAVAATLHFGGDAFSLPLAMLVITITAYGILAGNTALDDILTLRDDMDEDTANTAYGRGVTARNIPALKLTSTVLIGLTGLAELVAVLF